jgi:small subunit ribosomal protein S6
VKGGIALKTYELICILSPNLSNEEVEEKIKTWQALIIGMGGEVTKISRWGKRHLAYDVKKQNQGIFVLLYVKGSFAIKDEIERHFKISDQVIKFQSVKIEDRYVKLSESVADRVESNLKAPAETEKVAAPGEFDETMTSEESAFGDSREAGLDDDFDSDSEMPDDRSDIDDK